MNLTPPMALLAFLALTTVAPAQTTAPKSYVESIAIGLHFVRKATGFRGNFQYWIYGRVTVTVRDTQGQPVAGAVVRGDFTADVFRKGETLTGVTDADGVATMTTDQYFSWRASVQDPSDTPDYTMTFRVTGVDADPPYDSSLNKETEDTVSSS